MAEEKRKRLDSGRALFDTYQKKKHDSQGQSQQPQCNDLYTPADDNGSLDDRKPFIHLDAVTLVRRKEQFDSLDLKIKTLQESLSEKDEIITSLEIQNKILREGGGDHYSMTSESEKVAELTKVLESRNTYIKQVSESLLQRNNELKIAYSREKELTLEIDKLQQEICLKTKESQSKLRDSYNENVEYKAKVNILSNKVDEYANIIKSLKASIESNSRGNNEKQEELIERCKRFELDKISASRDIKDLMQKVEEQNKVIDRKEKELIKTKTELEHVRANQEEEIFALKTELEKKYCDDVARVEKLYDDMMLEMIRNSETSITGSETCEDIEKQITVYSESYEQNLKQLLAKSKFTEDQLQLELKKYKEEAEHYKQRVESIHNDLSVEINRLKHELAVEADKYKVEMEDFKRAHDEELKKLSKLISDSALVEAKKDVEIETYNRELNKCVCHIDNLNKELMGYKQKNNQQVEKILELEDKLKHVNDMNHQLNLNICQFKKNETRLVHKLNLAKSNTHDSDLVVNKLREQIGNMSETFTNDCAAITQACEEKLNIIQKELEESKCAYESKISQLTSKLDKQQELVKRLQGELVRTSNFSREESDLSYNEINQLKQKLAFTIQMSNDNQIFLLELLKGLREIKMSIKNLICSDEDSLVESASSDEIIGQISHKDLTGMLQKNLNEILELSRVLRQHMRDIQVTDDALGPMSPRMVTSTPIVKQTTQSDATSWMRKCTQLEKEKEIMSNQLELLNANIKQMEYCISAATEESGLFNKKCQILDKKLTEFENIRFSENALAKENHDLKEELKALKELVIQLQQEVPSLKATNIKLEEILNRNVSELYKKVSEDCISTEFVDLLTDLNKKSEENVELKSQLSTVQQSEQEHKLKVVEMQTKMNKLNTEHMSLKNSLDSKWKDLENLKREKDRLSIENQMLHTKLMFQQKFDIFGPKSTNSVLSNCSQDEYEQPQQNKREIDIPLEKNVDKCSFNRLISLHHLSAGRSLLNGITNPTFDITSMYDQHQDPFKDKAGGDLELSMPTIPEEEQDPHHNQVD